MMVVVVLRSSSLNQSKNAMHYTLDPNEQKVSLFLLGTATNNCTCVFDFEAVRYYLFSKR